VADYDDLLAYLRRVEGYTPRAAWDYKQNSVGYGTRARYPGEVIDRTEADRRLSSEADKARAIVDRIAPTADPGTKAALTSLTYNAGDKWTRSGLGDAIRAGDMDTARNRFLQYTHAGGKVLPGLVARRREEAGWINANNDGSVPPIPPTPPTRGAFQSDNGVPPIPPVPPTTAAASNDRDPDTLPARTPAPAGTLAGIGEAFGHLGTLLGLDNGAPDTTNGAFLPDDGVPPIPPVPHTSAERIESPDASGPGLPSFMPPPAPPPPPPPPQPTQVAKAPEADKPLFPLFGDAAKKNPMLAGAFKDIAGAGSGSTQAQETQRANQAMMQALLAAQAKQGPQKLAPLFAKPGGSFIWG
jgi:lysozyme